MNRKLWLLAPLVLAAGCAHAHLPANVCAESRDLICLTAPVCSLDRSRSCMVCICQGERSTPPPAAVPFQLPERPTPPPPNAP